MGFFSMPLVSGNVVCAKNDDRQLASKIEKLRQALDDADAVIVGAGAGMSTAAGLTYSGERFDEHFADFRDAFGITDMYSGGSTRSPTWRRSGRGGAAISTSTVTTWSREDPILIC